MFIVVVHFCKPGRDRPYSDQMLACATAIVSVSQRDGHIHTVLIFLIRSKHRKRAQGTVCVYVCVLERLHEESKVGIKTGILLALSLDQVADLYVKGQEVNLCI